MTEAVKAQAIELAVVRGKSGWAERAGAGAGPRRDQGTGPQEGRRRRRGRVRPHRWACSLWQVSDCRVHRWRARRRDIGTLVDRAPGGHPLHALLPEEVAVILDVAERWGEVDRSHRKLAHRGSYQQLVWVSPSTFRRVLVEHGLALPEPQPREPSPSAGRGRTGWCGHRTASGVGTRPISPRARRVCFAIIDVVSRKWIDTLVSVEETATQVQVIFEHALGIEGLLDLLTDERLDLDPDDPRRPILLAVCDNGPQMTADATREFLALMAIAQHLGRPHTPTDQAWIEILLRPRQRRVAAPGDHHRPRPP